MTDPVVLLSNRAPAGATYDFGPSHPLQPIRVQLMFDLMRVCGLLEAPGVTVVDPRAATRDELTAVHNPAYVDAVQQLGASERSSREHARLAAQFGFHSSDNPVFPGMHQAAALVAGSTVVAAHAVMEGRARHAFVPTGGLHHAHARRAAGFCIYNDPAVAIAAVRARNGARIAYVDVDAHHGDGVQEIFYHDPNVLTISIHESGRYLFPGTGFIQELGEDAGYGYSINVPLEPYAGDAALLRVVDEVVVPLVRAYNPDLLVTQCGCDSHWRDPLTHLAATTAIWPVLAETFHALAHEVCEGRWLATGGGGYDLYSVVPRAWTLLFAGMIGADLPEALPPAFLELRGRYTTESLATTFLDSDDAPIRADDAEAALHAAIETISTVRGLPLPFLSPHES
ncbi:MAG TPA: acetoin utilization protein AcuC [Chloroflexota bacterium]|nr:acetoin utilization protein AcuC [Chloroflexota bacterium]